MSIAHSMLFSNGSALAATWSPECSRPFFMLYNKASTSSSLLTMLCLCPSKDKDEVIEQTRKLNLFCHFAGGLEESRYSAVQSLSGLNKTLMEAMDRHNQVNSTMDLVLFEDAMAHVWVQQAQVLLTLKKCIRRSMLKQIQPPGALKVISIFAVKEGTKGPPQNWITECTNPTWTLIPQSPDCLHLLLQLWNKPDPGGSAG